MIKIENQISFDIDPGEKKIELENVESKKNSDKLDKREKKKTEERIKVESVERLNDELTGELYYRIVLFWETIQQSLVFVYYPKDSKVIWTSRPNFHISEKWWNIMVRRAIAVGLDHYKRDKSKLNINKNK